MKTIFAIFLSLFTFSVFSQQVDKAEKLFSIGLTELYKNNNPNKSIKLFTKAISIVDSSKYYAYRGLANMNVSKKEDAEKDFRASIKRDTRSEFSYKYLGILLYETGSYDSSIVYLQKDLELNGESFYTLLYLGFDYNEVEKFELALDFYKDASSIKPKNIDPIYNRAKLFIQLEKFDKAHKEVDKLKKYYANADFVYELEGDVYREEGLYDEALEAYQKAFDINPLSKYLDIQSSCYEMKKDFDEALVLVNKAYNIDPKVFYILHRATIYGQNYQFDLALKDFNKVITKDPDNIIAYLDRAFFVWFTKKEYEKAIEDLDMVIQLDSNAAFAYNNKGFAYWGLGDNVKALELVYYSLELEPENSYAFKNLALIYDTLGEEDEAIENAKKAIEFKYPFDEENDPFEDLLEKYSLEHH